MSARMNSKSELSWQLNSQELVKSLFRNELCTTDTDALSGDQNLVGGEGDHSIEISELLHHNSVSNPSFSTSKFGRYPSKDIRIYPSLWSAQKLENLQ